MVALLKLTKAGPVPTLLRKHWRAIQVKQWRHTGELWSTRYKAKRFTHAGAREYRFPRRKGELLRGTGNKYARTYTGRKEALFGHTLPNVYTGTMRRLVMLRDVRSSSKGVKMPLHANARIIPGRSRINQLRELTTVSAREINVLVKDHDRRLRSALAQLRANSTVRMRK